MKFYHIKDEYIDFLKKYDGKVAYNKQESRPYLGVVLEIDSHKYYAPFTSPKPKHQKMKNGIDFRKIGGGRYGAINFNNMIPVPDSALILLDINSIQDEKYRNLLNDQRVEIISDWKGITATALKLHRMLMKDEKELSDFEKAVKTRCCDIKLLESVYACFK